jgi:hypothetical protein
VSILHAPICQNEIQSWEEDTTSFLVPNVLQIPIKCASSCQMARSGKPKRGVNPCGLVVRWGGV